MKAWRRLFRLAVSLLVIGTLAVAAAAAWWLNRPLPLASDPVELSIEFGSSPREIADAWVRAGVMTSPLALYEWFRWSGRARLIRAGSYEISAGTTPIRLLEKMVRGDETLAVVRFNEGWTFRQIRAELARADALKPTSAAMSDAEVMQAIGAAGVSPEGRFHPDTYAYSKGSTDIAILKRAYRAMRERLDAAWQERDPTTPLKSADEALTLASIVEKETGVESDRGRVAGVFVNRLRLGMPLQTDPTVIFGLGPAFDGNLRKRDLLADTPYNTYVRAGLPPTPIAVPGKAALLAAVRPEATKALYFVARGDGSSEFSETLAEHNRAVNRYQRKAP
ncbi:MAG: endolytic transglycosylase MltG [Caldimonas sp.]